MSKVQLSKLFFVSFSIFSVVSLSSPHLLSATPNCGGVPDSGLREQNIIVITGIGGGNLSPSETYVVRFYGTQNLDFSLTGAVSNGSATLTIDKENGTINGHAVSDRFAGVKPNIIDRLAREGVLHFEIFRVGLRYSLVCSDSYAETSLATCKSIDTDKNHYQPGDTITVSGTIENVSSGTILYLKLTEPDRVTQTTCINAQANGDFSTSTFKVKEGKLGSWNIGVYLGYQTLLSCAPVGTTPVCTTSFTASSGAPAPVPTGAIADPCWDGEKAISACVQCLGGETDKPDPNRPNLASNSWTALGCIPNDPRDFVAWLLARAIGIGGGIAFLLMIWGGFQVITSAGDPDRLNAGKEVITSAIAGLLIIIFSLFLLELIGVDILGLEQVGFKFSGG